MKLLKTLIIPAMKSTFILFTLYLIVTGLTAQNADSIWILNNYTKIERQIPMRDGIKLFTAIYVPKDISTDHPVLMERTPYSCRPYGENSWFPLVDCNPQKFVNIYEAQRSDFQKAVIRIYHDAKAASNIVLPVLGIQP
jgi:predicted acyl esterase